MKPFGESDFLPTNERRLEEEWRQQKAEGLRRKWEYEGLTNPRFAQIKTPTGVAELKMGKGHFMDTTPPDIYVESPADLEVLKRELSDLERDIELMLKHETVRYSEEEK